MNNGDKTFLQKVKDNAFYLSLGIGLFAVLAVVGVYTAQQEDLKIAENEMDIQTASDYTELEVVEETNGEVADMETTQDIVEQSEETEEKTEIDVQAEKDLADETKMTTQNDLETANTDEIPTNADTGRLDFNSEKTITWPINGEVILPYSMETTVFFKTLDQYKCNPGMLIQAGVGDTVQNAYLGQVTSVTSDDTYGNMVTLYIGNEYSIVYGQLDAVYVKEGDFVKAGEAIGTIGNPTDSFREEGSHLFFQMKTGEEAIDPMLFIE